MKRFLLILLTFMMVAFAFAQTTITIGTGTTTGRYPLNDYFVHSRSQVLYTETEIGSPGTIQSLAWFRNDTGANPNAIGLTEIWLKTVSNPTLSGTDWEEPGTLVASIENIDLGAGNGWLSVDIEDYVYSGGNLLVSVRTQNAPYTAPHSYWRYSTATDMARLGNSDTANPPTMSISSSRPNIQITMEASAPSTAPNPAVLVGPADGGMVIPPTTLNWASGGGFPSSYNLYLGTTSTPALLTNLSETSYIPTLEANTTYYWQVVPQNAFGSALDCPVWSFTTPGENQLVESFEATGFPPAGWANPGGWSRSTTTPLYQGTATAYKYGSTSVKYILSTPMLTFGNRDALSFASRAGLITGTIEIVYSEDRVEWQLLEIISHSVASAWQTNTVDLSSLSGNFYLGFRTGLQSTGFYIDSVIGPDITPLAPGTPNLSSPADAALNQSIVPSLSWTAPVTGGVANSYNVYLDTESDPRTLLTNTTGTSYAINTPLAYGTTYYWKVAAVNPSGEGEASLVRSFTTMDDPSVSSFPWIVDFGTLTTELFPPQNWSRMGGQYPNASGTSTLWGRGNWLNGAAGNNAAKMNIYGTSRFAWLITPPIAIPEDGYELRFDLGLTRYNAVTAVDPASQLDDKFIVVMSDSPDMSNPTILREWNNSGSEYVYNAIPNTGTTISLPLAGIMGTKYFAFYGESTLSGGDNDMHVDNVTVREIPAAPIFAVSPTAWNYGEQIINTSSTRLFTISNNGGGSLDINSIQVNGEFFALTQNFEGASLGAGQSVNFTIEYLPTAEGEHSATVTISDGRLITEIELSGSCYDPTQPLPYLQDFEVGSTLADIGWIGDFSILTNHGTNGSKGMYKNLWSSTPNTYGVTPPIGPLAERSELKFDYRIVNYSSYPNNATTLASGDQLQILISSNNVDFTPIHTIDMNNHVTSTAFAGVTLDLSAFSGSILVKFAANWATGDYYLDIDNVMVRETPAGAPEPVTLVSPVDGAQNLSVDGFNLSWSPSLTGGAPAEYALYMGTSEDVADYAWYNITGTSFDPTQAASDPITFNYSETWYWTVQAINGDGDADVPAPFSFTIMDDPRILSLPYSQNFDGVPAASLPMGWTGYVNSTSTSAYVRTIATYPVSAPNSVYLTNSNHTAADLRLITPEIMVPMNTIKLSFSARGSSAAPSLLIGTVNALDGSGTFNQIASIPMTATHTVYTVSFADYAGTDQYICFKHSGTSTYQSIYIDNVQMEELLANDLAVTAFSGDSYGLAGDQLDYNITVTNNGTATQSSYSVQLRSPNAREVLATINVNESLAPGASALHQMNWTPSITGSYNIYAKVVLPADGNPANDDSDLLTVGIFSAASYAPFVGNLESTLSINSIPFHMYWKNSVAETIYLAHEMQMSSGTINAIVYHNNFTQNINVPVKVWMKHTTESLNSAWLSFDDYTLVYDGNVFFPAGVNAIVIPLQTPFQYAGGNIAVRTNRVMDTRDYGSNERYFYTNDTVNPNRTRHNQSDTSLIDPANPGLTAVGTQSSMIPNTGFIVDPYVALPTPGAPVVQITMSGTNPQLSWNAVDNAFVYVIYASDDPYNWSDETQIATTSALSYSITNAPEKKFFKVAARTYGHQLRSIGSVLNHASVIGFDNNNVRNTTRTINTEDKD